ncbi:MAG: class I SAM-dependent methyltransferase [Armatimonadetes bacterium]|nr:class I SAM-dependent methyltransferase [Armatimonadota bacterium]
MMFGMNAMKSIHAHLVFERRVSILAKSMAPLLPSGRILDVGCGDGTIDILLLAQRPDIEITGVDIFVRPNSRIPTVEFDGTNLPFEDNSFDCVMMVDVLHHVDDCLPLLRECARVAKKMVIKDHIANNVFDFQMLKLMDWVGNRSHGVVLPYKYLSSDGWDSVYGGSGFQRESTIASLPIYPFPFSALFGRKLHFIDVLYATPLIHAHASGRQ